MAHPTYKLTYFNVKARAEPARFIFAYAKVPYEDVRIEFADWPKIKYTFPWDQLPVLEVDGKMIAQSIAIARYLGRQFNLVGEDDFEAAKCDEYVDALMDSRAEWKKTYFETDPVKLEVLKKDLVNVHWKPYLNKFEQIAKNSGSSWLVGKNITWADLTVAHTLEFYEYTIDPSLLDSYPNLRKFKEAVYAIPEIKEWVAKRPASTR